jgi:hypothetical protein
MPEVTKISHGLTIGDLKFGNARPGVVEATLKPGETMEQALDELDERLNAWHRNKYPHLYPEQSQHFHGLSPIPESQRPDPLPVISKDHEKMEIAIDNCTTIEQLKAWKEANPVFPHKILVHYNNRLKSLTDGK